MGLSEVASPTEAGWGGPPQWCASGFSTLCLEGSPSVHCYTDINRMAPVWPLAPSDFCSKVTNLVDFFSPHWHSTSSWKLRCHFCIWNQDWCDSGCDNILIATVSINVPWSHEHSPCSRTDPAGRPQHQQFSSQQWNSHKTLKGIKKLFILVSQHFASLIFQNKKSKKKITLGVTYT